MPAVTSGTLVVFALVAVALVLFVTERVPNDTTAVGVLVSLAVLEPYTGVSAATAISGFASPATLTVVAMYVLSAGVQKTGVVERLGVALARFTAGDETHMLGATVGVTGVAAGIVNNTPVVAVFVPMITGLADRYGVSPSKLLLPLSYAAMLGGTLTLVGTSTNVLVSDLAAGLAPAYPSLHRLSMFEFTHLGALVFVVGAAYLLTVGRWLTPARVRPASDLIDKFALDDRLTRLTVDEDSRLVGRVPADALADVSADVALVQVTGDAGTALATTSDRDVEAGDVLTVRGSDAAVAAFASEAGLTVHRAAVTDDDLTAPADAALVEVVVPDESRLVDEPDVSGRLAEAFGTTVLAVRRGDDVLDGSLAAFAVETGDALLVQAPLGSLEALVERGDVVVTHDPEGAAATVASLDVTEADVAPLSPRTPVALGILVAVVGLAALGVVPIVIAALGGVVAMVVTGCLDTSEVYDAVSWRVVFLLAGVLPLGVAMQNTGGDALLASSLVGLGALVPPLVVLLAFVLLTSVLANVVTPVASAVLMVPVAVDAAARLGAHPFAFLIGVLFAANSAFMTPIGYQTNLMVYGPGGYTFGDYVRVGAPLQALVAVTATLGIAAIWGV